MKNTPGEVMVDGRKIAARIEADLRDRLSGLARKRVAFVLFLDTPATRQFVGLKTRVAERLGITAETIECLDVSTTEEAVARVGEISRVSFDGIVVQLPLPPGFDVQEIVNAVPVEKDLDVLGELAKNYFESGMGSMVPPVAAAVKSILDDAGINPLGKSIVVLGAGRLVGEPVGMMLAKAGMAFSLVDKDTPDDERKNLIANADIIISGVGIPHMVTSDMVREGVVLIDAGTSEQSGRLVGDIDPDCASKASLMTPVPGGVGPVTVACLFANLMSR